MAGPTTRVLALLELLQARGRLTGAEIARYLDVDRRTVRRYITVLEDLGIPVTTEHGRYGGYMLVPGFKLPPLMFNEEEVRVVTLALLAVRESNLLGADTAIESVQAKLERVMPAHLKAQVQAIRDTTQLITVGKKPNQHEHILKFTKAAQAGQGVSMTYHSPQGKTMQRRLDPYGLVFRAGYWYVSGYCHLRQALRSFRLDRLNCIELVDEFFERPPGFDAAQHLKDSWCNAERKYRVSVLLHTDVSTAMDCMSDMDGVLQQQEDGVLLTADTDSFGWFSWWLIRLPFRFIIQSPDALKAALNKHIERLRSAI